MPSSLAERSEQLRVSREETTALKAQRRKILAELRALGYQPTKDIVDG